MLRFQITGTSEIAKALQGLPARVSKQIAIEAMSKAVEPVVAAARTLVPVGETGGLKRSLGFAVRQYRKGRVTYGIIGARRGYGVPDPSAKTGQTEPANYAHLVEYGHAVAGDALAFVEPSPFLRPAWDATKGEVARILASELQDGIAAVAAESAVKKHRSATRTAARASRARAQAVALGAPV
jgi:HK97 gp10 family phage protein